MSNIVVSGVKEGNLKNISLEIPRDRLIVFTGLSGSGKSTLAVDVIFQECQRQYLEAIGLQGIQKPKVDFIRSVSPAIMITQTDANKNPRSTVGTRTDMYTDLRMVYEKLAVRICPHCEAAISAADCKEEVEKSDGEFTVWMICSRCHYKMEKLTRTHFSHNTKEGACPTCEGLGKVLAVNKTRTVQPSLSLEDGAVALWGHNYKEYQISCLYNAFRHYGMPILPGTPVAQFSDIQLSLWRRMSEKGGEAKQLEVYFDDAVCPDCKGERLGALSRGASVAGRRLPELSFLSLEQLQVWVRELEETLSDAERAHVEAYLLILTTKIRRIINMGLGYLSLDRQTVTLSGGELQRIKLAATLDSDLTGIIYILDEPTIGLHPKDTAGIIAILQRLRDMGNTVIVIEHDPDVMQAADYIVDIGPGAGKHGGEIVGAGTLDALRQQITSVTGAYLNREKQIREQFRTGTGEAIRVENADLYNLKNIDVRFPVGCLVAVTGVSGSGKSTLVFDVLAGAGERKQTGSASVYGTERFDGIVAIEQAAIAKMKRSNVATYSEVYTEIRKIFGGLQEAKDKGLSAKHFSFNTPGGRCDNCEGLGKVDSHMLFFKDIEITCPVCGGKQFNDEVLAVKYNGSGIHDILRMSVEEALEVFGSYPKIERILKLLQDVGLGYLELGQTLTTLSGGEGQRLKLAKELINNTGKAGLYLMDEPTTGLHPVDVDNFITLLNRIVEAGNTVIVVEHNQQVILASDWIIDLGPEGGGNGGEVVFAGTPRDMLDSGKGLTADCLRDIARPAE